MEKNIVYTMPYNYTYVHSYICSNLFHFIGGFSNVDHNQGYAIVVYVGQSLLGLCLTGMHVCTFAIVNINLSNELINMYSF